RTPHPERRRGRRTRGSRRPLEQVRGRGRVGPARSGGRSAIGTAPGTVPARPNGRPTPSPRRRPWSWSRARAGWRPSSTRRPASRGNGARTGPVGRRPRPTRRASDRKSVVEGKGGELGGGRGRGKQKS